MSDSVINTHKQSLNPSSLALQWPEIVLPANDVDLYKWAVIACDQHTTDSVYWLETARETGENPSTLHLILPEIYLEQTGYPVEEKIRSINENMRRYLNSGLLQQLESGCMIVDRSTPLHPTRKGLVLAIDLEAYDFTPGNKKLIRATEGTVLERIPPRMAIRRDALLELPHVQLLFDDPHHSVIEPLWAAITSRCPDPLYETGLMQGGGQVRGWFCPADDALLAATLHALSKLSTLRENGLLFVVGDGNHSLATAKAHWEALKDQVSPSHPARYALVEVINIHDPGLEFEPIHRIIFTRKPEKLTELARAHFADLGYKITSVEITNRPDPTGHDFILADAKAAWMFAAGSNETRLSAAVVQDWLDQLPLKEDVRIDYVHGRHTVEELIVRENLGILLPAMPKEDFFPAIINDGLLPKKTFSMGCAFEKRYYMECRRIR